MKRRTLVILSLFGLTQALFAADTELERAMAASSAQERVTLATAMINEARRSGDMFRMGQAHIVRAHAYLVENHFADALKDADAAISELPSSSRASALMTRADVHRASGDCNGAVADAVSAVSIAQAAERCYALYKRGRIEQACGRSEQALQDYGAAIRDEKPECPTLAARLELGTGLCQKRRFKQGLQYLSEAARQPARRTEAMLRRGVCLEDSGNSISARADYDKALSDIESKHTAGSTLTSTRAGTFTSGPNKVAVAIGYFRRARLKSQHADEEGALEDLRKAVGYVDRSWLPDLPVIERNELGALFRLRARLLKKRGDVRFAREDEAEACRWDGKFCP